MAPLERGEAAHRVAAGAMPHHERENEMPKKLPTAADRIDLALAALDAGFTSKAAQKRAQDELSRAFRMIRDRVFAAYRAAAPYQNLDRDLTDAEWQERGEYFRAREIPFDLHQIRDRHLPLFGEDAGTVEQMIEIRAQIKAAVIVPAERDQDAERETVVRDTIREMMEKRKAQYERALDLADMFGGLPVTANVHLVQGHKGTVFLRAFYYLRGEFTPLNVILAAADTIARREAE